MDVISKKLDLESKTIAKNNLRILSLSSLTFWILLVVTLCISSPKTLVTISQYLGDIQIQDWDKIGHFGLYLIGGLFLFGVKKTYELTWTPTLLILGSVTLFGEAVQLITPSRSALDPIDLLSNLLGCLLGLLIPTIITKSHNSLWKN